MRGQPPMSARRVSKTCASQAAAGTLHGPAIDLKPQFQAPTGTFVGQMAGLTVREDGPAMTELLMKNHLLLAPFNQAFGPPVKEMDGTAEKTRYHIKSQMTHEAALQIIPKVRKWIKVGGKNGMAPVDVMELLHRPRPFERAYNAVAFTTFPGETRFGIVFDGDNYEPHSAPFSELLAVLIRDGYLVVAIKDTPKVSENFYKGWIEMAEKNNNFFMAVLTPGTSKESVTESADALIYFGSTYVSKATGFDYRYKANGQETQGFSEIQAKKNDPQQRYQVVELLEGARAWGPGLVRITRR